MRLNLEKPREVIVAVADATITASILSTEDITGLRKKHTRYRVNMGETVEELDQRKYTEDFWDAVIVKWDGIEDASGTPLACTREIKYQMVNQYAEIALKINEGIEAARAATFASEQDALKN